MSLRAKFVRSFFYAFHKLIGDRIGPNQSYEQTTQFVKDRFHRVKNTATKLGKDVYVQFEEKKQTLAHSFEKECDVKTRYRRIQSKLAQDLAELEMRKAVLEKEVSAEERMLFEEAYEHARKEIIQRRMREASSVFYPNTHQKIRDEFLTSLAKILRGEKQSKISTVDEAK